MTSMTILDSSITLKPFVRHFADYYFTIIIEIVGNNTALLRLYTAMQPHI